MKINDKKLFFTSLITLIILIILDTVFKIKSFYYFYPNIDIIMHFIGGFSITTLSIAILHRLRMANSLNIVLMIFFVSIFWEYLEFIVGRNIYVNISFWIDTLVDLLMDALGGIMAYICFYKIPLRKKNLQK